jgi:cytochrome c5
MRHLTIPVALAVLFTVAGCGKSGSGSSGSSSSAAPPPAPATAPASAAPASSTAAAPDPQAAPTPSTAASSASGGGGSSSSSASGGTATASAGASGGNGEAIYGQTCVACHGAGVTGAPKIGDKADWGPRIAQGKDTLYTHALQGFQGKKGMMPPKGGNTALPDADVKAAVDFMVSKAQ